MYVVSMARCRNTVNCSLRLSLALLHVNAELGPHRRICGVLPALNQKNCRPCLAFSRLKSKFQMVASPTSSYALSAGAQKRHSAFQQTPPTPVICASASKGRFSSADLTNRCDRRFGWREDVMTCEGSCEYLVLSFCVFVCLASPPPARPHLPLLAAAHAAASAPSRRSRRVRRIGGIVRNIPALPKCTGLVSCMARAKCTARKAGPSSLDVRHTRERKRRATGTAGPIVQQPRGAILDVSGAICSRVRQASRGQQRQTSPHGRRRRGMRTAATRCSHPAGTCSNQEAKAPAIEWRRRDRSASD